MKNRISTKKRTLFIKQTALDLGFLNCGITKAEFLDREAKELENWLYKGLHGQMHYMSNHFDLRTDPSKLVPEAKSVISLAYNYHNPDSNINKGNHKISQYALGRDYHKVVKKKLKTFLRMIQDNFGAIAGRCFVDSAPVMERDLAKRAGLGWMGKNTLLIHPKMGSYFFLAEIILDLELEHDHQIKDHCGTCTKCIEACPTDAISPQGYNLDATKCISYATIELKEKIPESFKGKMENWIFGCDICQEVCPWNKFAERHSEQEFNPKDQFENLKSRDWEELTMEVFDEIFEGSAIKRTKFEGLKRNIDFLE